MTGLFELIGPIAGILILGSALAVWFYFAWNLWQNKRKVSVLRPQAWRQSAAPLVSIILPARNEARNICPCIASLLAQDYPKWELIVVDDESEDDTLRLLEAIAAQDSRVILVRGQPLPDGWIGKCWAIHQATAKAKGSWLFLTDADTEHDSQSLSAAMGFALATERDLVTASPFLVCKSFWERVVQPHLLLTTFAFARVGALEDPATPDFLAFGAYLLIRREVYDRVGGHEGVKTHVAEDLSLFCKIKGAGGRVAVTIGSKVFRVRMYTSLTEIWNGYSKNYAAYFGDWRKAFGAAVLWFQLEVLPWLALPWYLAKLGAPRHGSAAKATLLLLDVSALALCVILVTLVLVLSRPILRNHAGLGFGWTLAHPLAGAVLAAIMANSALRTGLGFGPVWKGRRYTSAASSRITRVPRGMS